MFLVDFAEQSIRRTDRAITPLLTRLFQDRLFVPVVVRALVTVFRIGLGTRFARVCDPFASDSGRVTTHAHALLQVRSKALSHKGSVTVWTCALIRFLHCGRTVLPEDVKSLTIDQDCDAHTMTTIEKDGEKWKTLEKRQVTHGTSVPCGNKKSWI